MFLDLVAHHGVTGAKTEGHLGSGCAECMTSTYCLEDLFSCEFFCPDASLALAASMVRAGNHTDDDTLGPGILQIVSALWLAVRRLAGAAKIFVGFASLEYFGYRLQFLVDKGPIRRRVATALVLPVSQPMGDTDELDAL